MKILSILEEFVQKVMNKDEDFWSTQLQGEPKLKMFGAKKIDIPKKPWEENREYIKLNHPSYEIESIPYVNPDIRYHIKSENEKKVVLSHPFEGTEYGLPNVNRYCFSKRLIRKNRKFMYEFERVFGVGPWICDDFYYTPAGGTCPWHTNSNKPYEKIQLTWARETNKSFLKYSYDGKGRTIFEETGWQVNRFTPTAFPPYFWHCVGSETDRVSFSFHRIPQAILKLNYDDGTHEEIK
jgi:hypothetical protein